MSVLNLTLARTRSLARAERSKFRWWSDGSGVYRLRLRGILPLSWVIRRSRVIEDAHQQIKGD